MPLSEAWKVLGMEPTYSRGLIKKAFRRKIREVHPDVTGDNGKMLQRVRDAFDTIGVLYNPTTAWDAFAVDDGLPRAAGEMLSGVAWSQECPGYAAFLEKDDQKALAVGEFNERTRSRPWAAVWGKYSQEEANTEALRVCRQYCARCKLIYVGSGTARTRQGAVPISMGSETDWWSENFHAAGETPGFGWMPTIDPNKERVVGYKNVDGNDRWGEPVRVRVPVFKQAGVNQGNSIPYYYSPLKPRDKVYMKDINFKHVRKVSSKSFYNDKRLENVKHAYTWNNFD